MISILNHTRMAKVLLGLATVSSALQASAQSTSTPVVLPGNPTCADLGYEFELKSDPPTPETYTFPGTSETVTFTGNGDSLSWTSTLSVDAVLMKGGPVANLYEYDPEATAGSGLSTPINGNNGKPYGLSHVSFCYDFEVQVTKTANSALKRTWQWSLAKQASPSALTLSDGQVFSVGYEVDASATAIDSDWSVSGEIKVHNPHPSAAATLLSVADVVSGDITASVDCQVSFPYALPSGATLTCTYASALPDASARVNTATVTTTGVVGGGAGTAAVSFANPTIQSVDHCVQIADDSHSLPSGTLCSSDAPAKFSYSLLFGKASNADVVLECGDNVHVNTVSITLGDGSVVQASASVSATVACAQGCTLTPGYWKTHSNRGPAPYDDTWAQLGSETTFFLSGQSYYQVLWTAPAGNAYYILAHAYIATELNRLNGAAMPANVAAAFSTAKALFEQYTPAQVAGLKGSSGNTLRSQFTATASLLDNYNNGRIGPGHCSE